ncbi:hypothetical protein DENSPDRAFT_427501 [Dentipellis sp. KUC8613]|nr:hypothetical protein DENSPDRAFT_427501 [Dentipellis sp. KUC8613]
MRLPRAHSSANHAGGTSCVWPEDVTGLPVRYRQSTHEDSSFQASKEEARQRNKGNLAFAVRGAEVVNGAQNRVELQNKRR